MSGSAVEELLCWRSFGQREEHFFERSGSFQGDLLSNFFQGAERHLSTSMKDQHLVAQSLHQNQ